VRIADAMNEAWMAQRLGLPLDWDAGVTTAEQRREKIRAAIVAQQRVLSIAGKRAGQPAETWKALFERVYRIPLQPKED
jgi:hypothetical protein